MEYGRTVDELLKKRTELALQITDAHTALHNLITTVDGLDATLRLFVPNIDLQPIRRKPLPLREVARSGEISRLVFAALRQNGAMTRRQIAEYVIKMRGLNLADKQLVRLIT